MRLRNSWLIVAALLLVWAAAGRRTSLHAQVRIPRDASVDVGLDECLQQSKSDCLRLADRHRSHGIAQCANALRFGCEDRRELVNRRLNANSTYGRDRFTEAAGRRVFVSVRKNEHDIRIGLQQLNQPRRQRGVA